MASEGKTHGSGTKYYIVPEHRVRLELGLDADANVVVELAAVHSADVVAVAVNFCCWTLWAILNCDWS